MSTMQLRISHKHKEAGMVAIMVTLILMIVISLLVLGFAQISRRNQRQALDRQLSTQAFYAAETGINDASQIIKNALADGLPITAKPDCQSADGIYADLDSKRIIDNASGVEYTCLTVDPEPASLAFTSIGTTSTVVPLGADSPIGKITLRWTSLDGEQGDTPADNCPANIADANNVFEFVPTSDWNCGYGVLRFDLVPTAGSSLSMTTLQDATMTSFLVPLRPTGTGAAPNPISYTPASTGTNNRLGVQCSNTECTQTIEGLNATQYYLRVSSLYNDVSLFITASDASDNPLRIQGAQAVIDATGKAEDVLRRIQVRIPLTPSSTNLLSDYAIQSTDAICKRFSVMDNYFSNDADDRVSGVAGSTTNPLCKPE